MFMEHCDKGLFTFYWEETHKEDKLPDTLRSQMVSPLPLGRETVGPKENERQENRHRTEKHSPDLGRYNYCLISQLDKENKNVLTPHTITLAPKINHVSLDNSRHQSKKNQFKSILAVKNSQKQAEEDEVQGQKPVYCEDALECHKKTLVIDDCHALAKASSLNTLRPSKIGKPTLKQAPINQRLGKDKFPSINLHSDSSQPSRLPLIFASKKSHKKMKRLKESFLLEKLWMQGHEPHSSVGNLGVNSVDSYKTRWQQRKADFIALLSKTPQIQQ